MEKSTKKARGIKRLFELDGGPEYVAKGFALGSFIGMMPIPGFQVIVSLGIASVVKVHKSAAVIGVFNTNIGTGAFFFGFNYWLGSRILGISPDFVLPSTIDLNFFSSIFSAGREVFFSMLVGGLISGIVFATLAYKIVLIILNKKNRRV